MKFKSTTGEAVHLALLSGHTAVVGTELTELPKMFHREAIAKGCLPEGVELDPAESTAGAFDRKKVIRESIEAMLDGTDPEDFTNDGKPKVDRVSAKVGFRVSREEADAVFEEITKPAGQ